MAQQWFTCEEAAVYMRCSRSFLDKKRVAGGGPKYYKVGAKILYAAEDLDSWRNDQRRLNTGPDGGLPQPPIRRRRRQRNNVAA